MQIVKPGTRIDFVSMMSRLAVVSAIMITAVIYLVVTRGFNYGIDFQGGTEVLVKFHVKTDPGVVRKAMEELNLGEPQVKRYGSAGESEYLIKVRGTAAVGAEGKQEDISDIIVNALAKKVGADKVTKLRASVVGPKAGDEFKQQGRNAVLVALAMLLIYIAIRFRLVYGIGALTALVHDTIVVIGALVITNVEFNLTTVAALLAIVGYSVNDTIVIFDRIRENARRFKTRDLGEQINVAINETLSRTVVTSLLTFLAVEALMILGGGDVRDFAFAVMVGVITGTYSSIYVASAVVLLWEKKLKPLYDDATDKIKSRA